MFKVQLLIGRNGACDLYRTVLPFENLRHPLMNLGIKLDICELPQIDPNSGHDAYIFNRITPPLEYAHAINKIREVSRVVWDLDDDLASIPDNSPYKKNFPTTMIRWLGSYLDSSDIITVSTKHLKEITCKDFDLIRNKVRVLPNLIDLNKYKHIQGNWFRQHKQINDSEFKEPIRVLFSGSPSHSVDMPEMADAAKYLLENPNVQLWFFGYMPSGFQAMHPERVVHVQWGDLKHYPILLGTIAPHVALIPLSDHVFNRSKSNIKFLEMSAAGAVCVASKVDPYSDTIEHGKDGFLAANSEEFAHYVKKAVEMSYDDRKAMWKSALLKVNEKYCWNPACSGFGLWIEFFKDLAKIPRRS